MLVTLLLVAQTSAQVPGMPSAPRRLPPVAAELAAVGLGDYDRRTVETRGTLLPFEAPHYVLEQGTVRVLVIPAHGSAASLAALAGRPVEMTGFVRRLYERQESCGPPGQRVPQSYCDDPDLPPTPDRLYRGHWPTVSLTAFGAFDLSRPEAGAAVERTGLAVLLAGNGRGDEAVTVRGRFCGRALCGLAAAAPPVREAWRIADGKDFVWVVGREPRGRGWRLDRDYAGDAARWVEVTGRLVACAAGRCLRASKVELVPAPRPPGEP